MTGLLGAVGLGGGNRAGDVAELQRLLNLRAGALGMARLRTDGVLDPDTARALTSYAVRVLGTRPPGKVGPGDLVHAALADTSPSALMREAARGREAAGRMSGAEWPRRNAAAIADSKEVADLSLVFAVRARRFLDALTHAGAQVRVEATRRTPARAWLIRNARAVARGTIGPHDVPPEPAVPIIWDHGTLDRSRAAAAEMAKLFGGEQPLPEGSPHLDGHVISMAVRWASPIELIDGYGTAHRLDPVRDAAESKALHAIGASYDVHKRGEDPLDWSIDGR